MYLNLIFISLLLTIIRASEVTIFPRLPIAVENGKNDLCKIQSRQYLENLENFTLWAYEMRDSSAQSSTSVLRGGGYNLGSIKQCMTADAPFPTQYCLAVVVANVPKTKTPRDPFSLEFDRNEHVINKLYAYKDETKATRNVVKMGWCIPASCSPTDAQNELNEYLKNYDHPLKTENVTFSAAIPPVLCQSSDSQNRMLDEVDISFYVVTAILVLLVVAGTFIDSKGYDSGKLNDGMTMLLVFSIKKSFNELKKPDNVEKPMKVFHGVKFFSIFMVIAGHRFGLFAGSPLLTFDYVEMQMRNSFASGVYHADLFVDSFFFIGGLLVTYIIMGLLDKNNFNPIMVIINRYLRLTPAYAYVLFFHATLLYHTGEGALWEAMIGGEKKDCRDNWWTGILYISNLVNSDHMCMTQSWYLPCDFHFFLLALLIIYLYHKNKKIGSIVLGLCILGTISVTFYLIYAYKRPAFLRFLQNFLSGPKQFLDYYMIYIKSYTRASPYFIGMIGGYIYYRLKGTDYTLTKFHAKAMSFFSYLLLGILLFSGEIFYNPYHPYNALESAFYGSLLRLLWGVGSLGVLFAISYGPHGMSYNLLSWYGFLVLSRLSYGAFLCHMGFQLRDMASTASPRNYILFDVSMNWASDSVLSFTLAFILYILVEEPFRKILKILSSKRKSESTQELPKKTNLKVENSKV